jgi:hypothetical protein
MLTSMLVVKPRAVTNNKRSLTEIDCTTRMIYVKDRLSKPGRKKLARDSNYLKTELNVEQVINH